MNTDQQREGLVNQAMSDVHTGLGVLLGAGSISPDTHQEILALLSQNGATPTTSITVMSQGQESGPSNLQLGLPLPTRPHEVATAEGDLLLLDDPPAASPKGKEKETTIPGPEPMVSQGLIGSRHNVQGLGGSRHSAQGLGGSRHNQPTQRRDSAVTPSGNRTNIICPWWATDGYYCKKGPLRCDFHHKDLPGGVKEPLVCWFFSDGNRCTKEDGECRFAHYEARHRQIAPMPQMDKEPRAPREADGSHDHGVQGQSIRR